MGDVGSQCRCAGSTRVGSAGTATQMQTPVLLRGRALNTAGLHRIHSPVVSYLEAV